MMITTMLFDLDGTLLPMNQDEFANAYVKGLATAAMQACLLYTSPSPRDS